MQSTLHQSEKILLISEINTVGQYTISNETDSSTIRGYSRKCQIEEYLTYREKRSLTATKNDDSFCWNKDCIYKNNQKRSKCFAITNFKETSGSTRKTADNTNSTVPAQRVIPGELLNEEFSNRFFVYKKDCKTPICNHINIVPNLLYVLRYFSKEDLKEVASYHNLFSKHIDCNSVHKSAILQLFVHHKCTRFCQTSLHFVEVYNDM
jgi:hypothetical protein